MNQSQPFVRPDVSALLAMMEAMNGNPIESVPVAEGRQSLVTITALAESAPRELALVRDLSCPGPVGDIPLRVYDKRAEREAGPLVMFFHGGGFVIGDLETHHAFCTEVAHQLDLPVLAVDYRLAPETPLSRCAR